MSEEITGSPETFDLIGAIEGTTFPEKTVDFLFDAAAANTLAAINRELEKFLALGMTDSYNDLEKVYFKAIEDLKDHIYKVTVRAVPRKTRKGILAEADAKYPVKRNAITGQEEPDFDKMEFLNLLTWRAHIQKFEDPQGRVVTGPLPRETVEHLLDNAPDASIAAVSQAIDDLTNGAQAGYEQAVRNLDFLSEPSPEGEQEGTPQASE